MVIVVVVVVVVVRVSWGGEAFRGTLSPQTLKYPRNRIRVVRPRKIRFRKAHVLG